MIKIKTEKDAQTKKYKVGDVLEIHGEKFQLIELVSNPFRAQTQWGLVCLKNGRLGLTLESPQSIVAFYLNCWEEEDEAKMNLICKEN